VNEKPTILFVDDEERIVRSLRLLFRDTYNVLTTTIGQDALHIVNSQTVHVIVSDQRMPNMTGVELLRKVKVKSPKTMRILLTGYSDKEAVIGSINDGEIFRYINKPWNTEDIRSTIAKAAEIAINSEDEFEVTVNSRKIILVLDEDPDVASFVQELVSHEFGDIYSVEWATSFESAVDILSRGNVAVVVTELSLTGDDVEVFITSLKHHAPSIVTIVTSAHHDTNVLVTLINEGQIYRFLPKPLRHGMLAMALNGAFRRYRAINSRPALLNRHVAEEPRYAHKDASLTGRIMGLFRNINRSHITSTP